MNATKEAIIVLKDFRKEFGQKLVLDKLNLEIKQGEIFGIVGMSGSGKTTILNSIIGFYQPEEGDVLFKDGENYKSVYKHPLHVNGLFGFASQQASVYPRLTVEENLDHFGSLYNIPSKQKHDSIQQLLKLTKLEDSRTRLAVNLSGGMQKRLSIACALIHSPKVLILDEPTSDLDPLLRKQTWDLITRINENGTTVIIASHFLEELEHTCHNMAILHNAQLVAVGSPDELKDNFSKDYQIHLETEQADYKQIIASLKTYKSIITNSEVQDNRLILHTSKPDAALHYVLHTLHVTKQKLADLYVSKPSLNEVFASLTQEKQ